jgi:anti-sigma factor ChrR (cupin superfamily)
MSRERFLLTGLFEQPFDAARYSWEPFREGVQIARLYGGAPGAAAAAFLRYAPGASVPRHAHTGFEHILVLEGAQVDEDGRYERGSLLVHAAGTSHRVASPEGCVVLAIWERPVEMLE